MKENPFQTLMVIKYTSMTVIQNYRSYFLYFTYSLEKLGHIEPLVFLYSKCTWY